MINSVDLKFCFVFQGIFPTIAKNVENNDSNSVEYWSWFALFTYSYIDGKNIFVYLCGNFGRENGEIHCQKRCQDIYFTDAKVTKAKLG